MNTNKEEYVAVIQAGGKGTRMRTLTHDIIPKPMLELNGKPMIQWQIENAAKYGIRRFIIIVGHLAEVIESYFGDGSAFGVEIEYIHEKRPLGSAGALYYLRDKYGESNIILIFGDVMYDIDWHRMVTFHEEHDALVTLLAHPNGHPYDSDVLIVGENQEVTGIDSKNHKRDYWYDNIVNAGICILDNKVFFTDVFDEINGTEKVDLEKDVIVNLLSTGRVYAYITPEYVKDVGTPERFETACREQKNGIWEHKNLSNKQKCLFLDRDGTINIYKGLISKEEQLELEPYAAEAIKRINESGYLAILVTNQPVVARGMCSMEDVQRIHRKLQVLLGREGAYLDDIVFCPHHPDKGYPEENPKYKVVCKCRKPSTLMIDQMVDKYNIDVSQSYMIGDSTIDIQTGINAGLKTVLVKTGKAGNDDKYGVNPDAEKADLLEAINYILKK